MYGALAGDIAGSCYEFNNIKTKDFVLFENRFCKFTDDSVMTIAVAKALNESKKNNYEDISEQLVKWMHEIGKRYPFCGYGNRFYNWIFGDKQKPYYSYGNGSAMRVSECGWIAKSLDEALYLAEKSAEVTHNHPEGIKGAQAVAGCIYLLKNGASKKDIYKFVEDNYYKLNFTLKDIRPAYRFDVSCQGSVPEAIVAFLESESFEDTLKNAISIGGDSDTIAAIAGSIAEAFYGVPEEIKEIVDGYFDEYLLGLIKGE